MKSQNNNHSFSPKNKSINIDELKSAVKNGSADSYIEKNLPPDAALKIKQVLSDSDAVQKLMSTPQAKELMNKFAPKESKNGK